MSASCMLFSGAEYNTAKPVEHTEANGEASAGDPHNFQYSRVPQLLGNTHVVELGRDELIVRLNAPRPMVPCIRGGKLTEENIVSSSHGPLFLYL